MTLKELREKRRQLIEAARELDRKADSEKRSLTDEERGKFDELIEKSNDVAEEIERKERLAAAERDLEGSAGTDTDNDLDVEQRDESELSEERHLELFRSLLAATDRNTEFRAMTAYERETRDLQVDIDTSGGYLVPPMQFVNQLIKAVDDMTWVRQLANVIPVTNADSLGAPSLDADPDDAEWTAELGTGSDDDAMRFGGRELHPHPLAKRIKVSKKLIRTSAIAVDQLVRGRLAYKLGVSQEKAFMTGDGSNKPLGVFTASPQGIPTSRDIQEDNTTTEIRFDNLKRAKYSLKQPYWARANWIFHRDAVSQLARIKDLDQQYIWQQSVVIGEPDRLMGFPVRMSEFAPNTFTASQYVGLLGDLSNYWIADALTFALQVLTELYAEKNQNGYIVRAEVDGMPVLAEAFARIQLASS